MQLAIGAQPIALCVQAHPLGGLLLSAYSDVSDGGFGVACVGMCSHAALKILFKDFNADGKADVAVVSLGAPLVGQAGSLTVFLNTTR
jgi:hypothetical protein